MPSACAAFARGSSSSGDKNEVVIEDADRADELAGLALELNDAATIHDTTERLLEVAAIVSEAVRDLGLEPVVVGGLALAHWSDNAFLTADIDVVMRRPAGLPARLAALGFRNEGREWVLGEHDISFEAPSETLEPGDEAKRTELPSGRSVLVLSPEDLLLWRLREWVHWGAVTGFRQAAYLLLTEVVDSERLERRAAEEGLTLAFGELRRLTGAIEKGRAFEEWELSEIARRVERESYRHDDDQT